MHKELQYMVRIVKKFKHEYAWAKQANGQLLRFDWSWVKKGEQMQESKKQFWWWWPL